MYRKVWIGIVLSLSIACISVLSVLNFENRKVKTFFQEDCHGKRTEYIIEEPDGNRYLIELSVTENPIRIKMKEKKI